MAIKARADITLSAVVDVESVWRYYKLQPSTASAPSKPTVKPPSGWTTTEPTYTEGSTNTLYFCDLTVFCDGTFSYSDVSKSSAYEAAKLAYQKAIAANTTANAANTKIDNLEVGGRNLLKNTASAKTIIGTNTTNQTAYFLMWDAASELDIEGKQLTFSAIFEMEEPISSGTIRIQTGSNHWQQIGLQTDLSEIQSGKRTSFTSINPSQLISLNGKDFNATGIRLDNVAGTIVVRDAKLEIGNKATDWTPAPEDVEADATSKANSAQATAISTAAADATSKANAAQSAAISAAATDATNKVNAIEIGGRNLYLGTQRFTGDQWENLDQWQTWDDDDGLGFREYGRRGTWQGICQQFFPEIGQTYTLSFWAKGYDGASINVYTDWENTATTPAMVEIGAVTGEYVRYSATFTSNVSTEIFPRVENSVDGAWVQIYGLKLEKGNKPSDWSPAPEDVDAAIDNLSLEVTTTQQEMRLDFTNAVASASNDLQGQMQASNEAANQKFGEISKYIRFVDGKIVLGEVGNELTLTITNDRVSFTQSGVEVAYFSDNNLYIKRAEVLTTLKVGNYEFAPRNDGGLALRKWSE